MTGMTKSDKIKTIALMVVFGALVITASMIGKDF
mgnify:FL=1